MGNNSLVRTDNELAELYQRHADLVYRLSYILLKNSNKQKRWSSSFC